MNGELPGAERMLLAQARSLPQPDQLCGPYAARVALSGLLAAPDVPTIADLALAAGTRVWPDDVPTSRPRGAPLDRRDWAGLPRAGCPEESGTDAGPLAAGIARVAPVEVEQSTPVTTGELAEVLSEVRTAAYPAALVANIRTGPLGPLPTGERWDVGHFVVLWSFDGEIVGIADSYAEAGAPGWPRGCRGVRLAALHEALHAPPGRSLLRMTALDDEDRADTATTGWP